MKTLVSILGALMLVAVAVGGWYFSRDYQLSPDDIFVESILGKWENTSRTSKKTYIEFKKKNRCNYHTEGNDSACLYQAKNSIIVIAITTTVESKSVYNKLSPKDTSYDLRTETDYGIEIDRIHIKGRVMDARRRVISGIRYTTAKSIKLKKVGSKKKSGKKRKKRKKRKK